MGSCRETTFTCGSQKYFSEIEEKNLVKTQQQVRAYIPDNSVT